MKKINWWNTKFTEEDIEKVSVAIRNKNISMGDVTKELESELSAKLNVPYVVCTTSGSIAILMALIASDIKEDDEVLVPNRTWISAIHAILMLRAKPIIIDVKKSFPIMDTKFLENYITNKTRAIIPTQINGRAVEMEKVWNFAKKHNLIVIEDSAQALFSKYKDNYMGTKSDYGCFSFSVAKLLPTGQGGFVSTNKKENYLKLLKIRTPWS